MFSFLLVKIRFIKYNLKTSTQRCAKDMDETAGSSVFQISELIPPINFLFFIKSCMHENLGCYIQLSSKS